MVIQMCFLSCLCFLSVEQDTPAHTAAHLVAFDTCNKNCICALSSSHFSVKFTTVSLLSQ
jgi:hypothetical protein